VISVEMILVQDVGLLARPCTGLQDRADDTGYELIAP
jgi:hypothetical protein